MQPRRTSTTAVLQSHNTLKAKSAAASLDQLERHILQMTRDPTPLLKFGKGGKPGFRAFTLSNDLLSLTWQSKNKAADKTRVDIKDMKEIRYGQRTEKFKKNNRPDLENLSFSIMYVDSSDDGPASSPNSSKDTTESLDLVCKDEQEFQMWTGVLSNLISGQTDLTQYLLAIQKRDLQDLANNSTSYSDGGLTSGGKKGGKHHGGGKGAHSSIKTMKDAFREANDVYSFGCGGWGQNGIGNLLNTNDMGEICPQPKLLESLLGKHVVQIAQGWSHTAVLLESGELLQYGNRIGTGLNEDYVLPTLTPFYSLSEKINIVALACGAFHTAALTDRGHVLSWGSSVNGQLGHGDNRDVMEPKFIESLRGGGGGGGIAHSSSNTSLGSMPTISEKENGNGLSTPSPTLTTHDVFVVQIACGSSFTAMLTDESQVFTCGAGAHGVLGHNDTHDRDYPTLVQDLTGTDIQKIACGDAHMFACTTREVYAWGWNAAGQLGLGNEDDQYRPHVIESIRGNEVKEIAAGVTHTIALVLLVKMHQEVLFSWGSNQQGQAGQGKKLKLLRPTPVPELKLSNGKEVDRPGDVRVPIVEIKCGAFHTLIRNQNGEVYATGSNKYAQCGTNPRMSGEQYDEFRVIEFLKDKIARSLCCGGENSSVLTARAWVDDSLATECMGCKSLFTFVNRKHHCRNCGGIFCGTCSSKKIAILRIQLTEPVRVCNSCFTMLGGGR